MKVILLLSILLCAGCATKPQLPEDLNGQAAIVLGYSADWVESDQGGNIYTGMQIEVINGVVQTPPLQRYDYLLVPAGAVDLKGHCWWRLRGALAFEDDLWEPVDYRFTAKPNHVYTLSVDIDDYKVTCAVDYFEAPRAQ